MAKTASDLADQALRELSKLDAVEAASAEDSTYIQDLAESYHETLPAYAINVTWDRSDIPNKVFLPLAAVIADIAARSYGVTIPEVDRQMRLQALRAAAAFPYLGTTLTAEYI